MATPNIRSLVGATHVPIRRREYPSVSGGFVAALAPPILEDMLKEDGGTTAVAAIGTVTARPFAKARLVAKLCENRTTAETIAVKYRETYLSSSSDLSDEERGTQSRILEVIENYKDTYFYRGLVSAMRDTSFGPLLNVVKNWLKIEHQELKTSLEDWIFTAKEVAEEEKAETTETSHDVAAEIAKTRAQISSELDRLILEIAKLGKKYSLNEERSAEHNTKESSILRTPEKESRYEEIKAEPFVSRRSKAKAWNKLWQDNVRKNSAKFLAAYMVPNKIVGDTILGFMGKAATSDTIHNMNDMILLEGVKYINNTRYKDIGSMVKEITIEPIGILYLERLDFTPIGNARGELVYSLPLTPKEKATLSHKEWSHTSEEYVKEVEEEFEWQIEKEVSESTELTESSKSETEVSHKVAAEVKTGAEIGSWTLEAKVGYDYDSCKSNAIEQAIERNREVTNKASSRSKEQHKITFTIKRERRVEDEHVREIENQSDEAVRWDFYRLMKKWQIDLYHIGERLTYEVIVPEPGDYLLRKYVELKEIQDEIDSGDPFNLSVDAITRENWAEVASEWGAELSQPPQEEITDLFFHDFVDYPGKKAGGNRILEIEVPDGYAIIRVESLLPSRTVAVVTDRMDGDRHLRDLEAYWNDRWEENSREIPDNARRFSWVWYYSFDEGADYTVRILLKVKALCRGYFYRKWQVESWNKLREAARVKWITKLEGLQSQRDRLAGELLGKDSLKLRQIEREEIMKGVLRWLLGPEFEFYPDLLQVLHEHLHNRLVLEAEETNGKPPALDPLAYYDENTQRLLGDWYQDIVAEYGDIIRFIHQAIEWENVKWVLYPYFWTFPGRWDFKQSMEHPDFYHRSFLRAGCARVIIPIREGFEKAWLQFAEGDLPETHPYITVAEEIKSRAETNYVYTPDPNRDELETHGEHIDRWFEYTPTGALHVEQGETPADW